MDIVWFLMRSLARFFILLPIEATNNKIYNVEKNERWEEGRGEWSL